MIRNRSHRYLLPKDKLEALENWLTKRGWVFEEPRKISEMLRAVHQKVKHPIVVYDSHGWDPHYTVTSAAIETVKRFVREEVYKNVEA